MQKRITALVGLGVAIGTGCIMAASGGAEEIGEPIEFHPGEVARSADVNSNFGKVYDQVNKIGRAVTVDEANGTLNITKDFDVNGNVTGDLNVTGNLTVTGPLKITSGNPGGGKVLASDADGTAFWKANDGMPLVTSAGGRIWMAKDLGAMRVATQMNDPEAYGWLFQWGREADGHQYRTSNTIECDQEPFNSTGKFVIDTSPASTSYGDYYLNEWNCSTSYYDVPWKNTSDGGPANPCPVGFRIPTKEEWEAEIVSWGSRDAEGAFASPLKLGKSGRHEMKNDYVNATGLGTWWGIGSNPVSASQIVYIVIESFSPYIWNHTPVTVSNQSQRGSGTGRSVRCIQHQ